MSYWVELFLFKKKRHHTMISDYLNPCEFQTAESVKVAEILGLEFHLSLNPEGISGSLPDQHGKMDIWLFGVEFVVNHLWRMIFKPSINVTIRPSATLLSAASINRGKSLTNTRLPRWRSQWAFPNWCINLQAFGNLHGYACNFISEYTFLAFPCFHYCDCDCKILLF